MVQVADVVRGWILCTASDHQTPHPVFKLERVVEKITNLRKNSKLKAIK